MRTFIASAALAAAMAVPLAASPAAHAEDQRPCVSMQEWHSLQLHIPLADLERRWDVEGHGKAVPNPGGGPERRYRACGYSLAEATIWIAVEPSANPRVPIGSLSVVAGIRFRADGATLQGHN